MKVIKLLVLAATAIGIISCSSKPAPMPAPVVSDGGGATYVPSK